MKRAVVLRERPEAVVALPKQRPKAEKSRRALASEVSALAKPHPSTKVYARTSTPRGTSTPLAMELAKAKTLEVTPKPPPASAESLATRCARKAALARWRPGQSTALVVAQRTTLSSEALQLVPSDGEARHWRRGESKVNTGTYRQAPVAEVILWVERMVAKECKWTDMQLLYDQGKIRVSPGTIRKIVYDKTGQKLAALKAKGFTPMGAPRQVRTQRLPRRIVSDSI
jgi:hypothetical protein